MKEKRIKVEERKNRKGQVKDRGHRKEEKMGKKKKVEVREKISRKKTRKGMLERKSVSLCLWEWC